MKKDEEKTKPQQKEKSPQETSRKQPGLRQKKIALIEPINLEWQDLAETGFQAQVELNNLLFYHSD